MTGGHSGEALPPKNKIIKLPNIYSRFRNFVGYSLCDELKDKLTCIIGYLYKCYTLTSHSEMRNMNGICF